jgi:hypothetical protein
VAVAFGYLPTSIVALIEAAASLTRVQQFLMAEDMDYKAVENCIEGGSLHLPPPPSLFAPFSLLPPLGANPRRHSSTSYKRSVKVGY